MRLHEICKSENIKYSFTFRQAVNWYNEQHGIFLKVKELNDVSSYTMRNSWIRRNVREIE